MKISPQHAPRGLTSAATPPDQPAQSFAQLIESGQSAGTITRQRARGFSEAGLMGLHFASEGSVPRHGEAKPGAASPQAETAASFSAPGVREQPAMLAGQVLTTEAEGLGAEGGSPGRPALHSGISRSAPFPVLSQTAETLLPRTQQGETAETASNSSLLSRLTRGLALRTVNPTAIRLSLVSEGNGMAIVLHGFTLNEEESLEFERNARSIAAEFGVTVNRLIVTGTDGARGMRREEGMR